MDTQDLITRIKDKDETVRADAWLNAGPVGGPAVKPLAEVMTDSDLEVARAAKRALWKIVRHAGRPGADAERKAVGGELNALCGSSGSRAVLAEVLWMLSEIGGDESVDPLARLLANEALREDARMALQRIPGIKSLAALRAGLAAASDDFKPHIAQSLRQRGVKVPGLPCRKLVPARQTKVTPVGR